MILSTSSTSTHYYAQTTQLPHGPMCSFHYCGSQLIDTRTFLNFSTRTESRHTRMILTLFPLHLLPLQ